MTAFVGSSVKAARTTASKGYTRLCLGFTTTAQFESKVFEPQQGEFALDLPTILSAQHIWLRVLYDCRPQQAEVISDLPTILPPQHIRILLLSVSDPQQASGAGTDLQTTLPSQHNCLLVS